MVSCHRSTKADSAGAPVVAGTREGVALHRAWSTGDSGLALMPWVCSDTLTHPSALSEHLNSG